MLIFRTPDEPLVTLQICCYWKFDFSYLDKSEIGLRARFSRVKYEVSVCLEMYYTFGLTVCDPSFKRYN